MARRGWWAVRFAVIAAMAANTFSIIAARPAAAERPTLPCFPGSPYENTEITDNEDPSITWICRCYDFTPVRTQPLCIWVKKDTGSTAAQHRQDFNPVKVAVGSSVLSQGNGGGFPDSVILTDVSAYMAVRFELWRWGGSAWNLCTSTNYFYSPSPVTGWGVGANYSSPPCGAGYYGIWGAQYVDDGGWRGDYTWSGYRYISGFLGLQAAEVASDPPPTGLPRAPKAAPTKHGPNASRSNPPSDGLIVHGAL